MILAPWIVTLLQVLIFLAACSVLWWLYTKLTIPEPVKSVLTAVILLVMLAFVWSWIASGHLVAIR